MRPGAAIEQDDPGALVEHHGVRVPPARSTLGGLPPRVALPDPGVVEEGLRAVRSRWRARAAEQDDLPAGAVEGQGRPAAARRPSSGDLCPAVAPELPGV